MLVDRSVLKLLANEIFVLGINHRANDQLVQFITYGEAKGTFCLPSVNTHAYCLQEQAELRKKRMSVRSQLEVLFEGREADESCCKH